MVMAESTAVRYAPPLLLEREPESSSKLPEAVREHFQRGYELYHTGEFEKALQEYEAALKIAPDDAEAHYNRGVVLGRLGRHQEALEAFERAIALGPDYAEAHHNRGMALGQLGRYAEALEAYERAIALRPDFAEAREGHRLALELVLRRLARRGIVSWRGGKPKGYSGPMELTPGPPISQYVIEGRR